MNKDIKEILEDFKNDVENNLWIETRAIYYKPLLDYITNLEQENERLKEEIEILTQDDDNDSVWNEEYNM